MVTNCVNLLKKLKSWNGSKLLRNVAIYDQLQVITMIMKRPVTNLVLTTMGIGFALDVTVNFCTIRLHSVIRGGLFILCPTLGVFIPLMIWGTLPRAVGEFVKVFEVFEIFIICFFFQLCMKSRRNY